MRFVEAIRDSSETDGMTQAEAPERETASWLGRGRFGRAECPRFRRPGLPRSRVEMSNGA